MSIIQHYDTGSLLAETETWLDSYMPPPDVIEKFCVLLEHGFDVKTNSPTTRNSAHGTITAKKDHIKIHWSGSNKQVHVSIKVGQDNYARAKEGPGVEKFGRLCDVDKFLAELPPDRNPLFEYGEAEGRDFVSRIAKDKQDSLSVSKVMDYYHTARVKFLCRVYNGLILTDIDDPFNGPKCTWFAIDVSGQSRSGVILYDRQKWLPATKEADRVFRDTNMKLTAGDKELLDAAIEQFAMEVFKRPK